MNKTYELLKISGSIINVELMFTPKNLPFCKFVFVIRGSVYVDCIAWSELALEITKIYDKCFLEDKFLMSKITGYIKESIYHNKYGFPIIKENFFVTRFKYDK